MRLLVGALLLWMAMIEQISGGSDIVMHSTNPDKTILVDRITLQQVFTGHRQRWSNGEPIVAFIKPTRSVEHQDFVRNVLKMTTYRFNEMVAHAVTDGHPIPKIVTTDEMMAMKVSQTRGGIGYINYAVILNGKSLSVIDGDTIK